MKVLVTGGAGFIGGHIVDKLVERGYDVRVFDKLEEQVHGSGGPSLPDGVEFVRGDVNDPTTLLSALKGVDVISHHAAMVGVGQSMYEPTRYLNVNTVGTALLYELIIRKKLGVKKIIVASSKSTYGEGAYTCDTHGEVYPGLRPVEQLQKKDWEPKCPSCGRDLKPVGIKETKPQQNLSTYALSKYDQERLAINYANALGITTVAFRYFNVFGPRQSLNNPYTGVCAIFASRLRNGNDPVIYEDGKQLRDFIYIDDIVEANVMAIEKAETTEVYNVGTGNGTSILKIAETLAEELGVSAAPKVTGEFRPGDNRHDFADTTKIKKELGFEAKVSFRDGMKKFVEWSLTQQPVDSFEKAAREFSESLKR